MDAAVMILFVVSPLTKVFSDAPVPSDAPRKVVLWCARNEYESGQIAVRSAQPMTGLAVRFGPLTHESGYALPSDGLRWNFVGAIPLTKNTPCENAATLVRKAPCDMPDVLLADRRRDVPANTTQAIYLTVLVPKEAPPGLYSGKVAVTAGEHEAALPIELTVWPFVLPDERHLLVTNWVNLG
ncbi:MAG: hypothetical protein FJ272_03030, partial [Planctomycetes bacterium]|nr:hypothetical protein [Planctomycetota bacterium]